MRQCKPLAQKSDEVSGGDYKLQQREAVGSTVKGKVPAVDWAIGGTDEACELSRWTK